MPQSQHFKANPKTTRIPNENSVYPVGSQSIDAKAYRDPFYLVFKNLQKGLTLEEIIQKCSEYGEPFKGRQIGDMYFVNFRSMSTLENAFEGLSSFKKLFRVEMGRNGEKAAKEQQVHHLSDTPIMSSPSERKQIETKKPVENSKTNNIITTVSRFSKP